MEIINNDIVVTRFRKRRMPLSADFRPLYKVGQIVMILRIASNGNKASLNKLHFLINALKSNSNMRFFKNVIESPNTSSIFSWGVEPALNRALVFAVADEILGLKDDKYFLKEKGEMLAKRIENDTEVFIAEKEFLAFIGKRKVTEAFISTLTNKKMD